MFGVQWERKESGHAGVQAPTPEPRQRVSAGRRGGRAIFPIVIDISVTLDGKRGLMVASVVPVGKSWRARNIFSSVCLQA